MTIKTLVKLHGDNLFFCASLVFFSIVLIRSSWIAEDAFITFRSVLNFIHGYGPVWNVGERVQVFTHPLWFLLLSLSGYLFGHVVYIALFLSIFFSISSLFFLWNRSKRSFFSGAVIILLGTSKAFVEYATSALENSLSIFLLGLIFFILNAKSLKGTKRLGLLLFVSSLLALNREDNLILVIFVLLCNLRRGIFNRFTIMLLIEATSPLWGWLLFSLVYYGTPFPNTYYAKLPDGINHLTFFNQGIQYFLDSATRDPITLITICVGIVVGVFAKSSDAKAFAVGLIAYLLYILWIGGDYMTGRFFMVPMFLSVLLLVRFIEINFLGSVLLAFSSVALCLYTPTPIILNNISNPGVKFLFNKYRVINERALWWKTNGLLSGDSLLGIFEIFENNWKYNRIDCVIPAMAIGRLGVMLGPNIHIVDWLGLGDPLLARLPVERLVVPGHYGRKMPRGYMPSIFSENNVIVDPAVHALYSDVRLASHGDLWSLQRARAIARLFLRQHKESVSGYYKSNENSITVPLLQYGGFEKTIFSAARANQLTEINNERTALCEKAWVY